MEQSPLVKIPHQALVALATRARFVLMRNVGHPFEPKLELVTELDLELTNYSAGILHQDPAGHRSGSTDLDEQAPGAAIDEWLNTQALRGGIGQLVIAADSKTLGQIRQ